MENFFKIFIGLSITIFAISFFIKNIITAKKVGGSIKGKSWKVRVLVIMITALYFLTYLALFIDITFLYSIDLLNVIYIKITGIVLVSVALIIGILTLITMKNSWRMGITEGQNTELIVNGIFRYSRNPYFLSYYLIFFGIFLVYPMVVFLLIYIPAVIITHLMVLDEEAFLANLHGSLYLNYKKSVKRYISF